MKVGGLRAKASIPLDFFYELARYAIGTENPRYKRKVWSNWPHRYLPEKSKEGEVDRSALGPGPADYAEMRKVIVMIDGREQTATCDESDLEGVTDEDEGE
jgi:hypothetical protein